MHDTIEATLAHFDLDPAPTIQSGDDSFHARPDLRGEMVLHLKTYDHYPGVTAKSGSQIEALMDPIIADLKIHEATPNHRRSIFHSITPRPHQYRVEFGFFLASQDDQVVLGAHADTDLWIKWNGDEASFDVQFGLFPWEHQDDQNHSDGVGFIAWGIRADGNEHLIWERWIDPWNNPHEWGIQADSFTTETGKFTQIRFATRSGPTKAYDSAYWGQISIR